MGTSTVTGFTPAPPDACQMSIGHVSRNQQNTNTENQNEITGRPLAKIYGYYPLRIFFEF